MHGDAEGLQCGGGVLKHSPVYCPLWTERQLNVGAQTEDLQGHLAGAGDEGCILLVESDVTFEGGHGGVDQAHCPQG